MISAGNTDTLEPLEGSELSTRRGDLPRFALMAAALTLVIGGAIYLRVARLGKPALWLDEILNYDLVREARPMYAWLIGFERENGPLYYLTQLIGQSLVRDAELQMRILPALFGILSIPLMALLAWRATGRRVVVILASLLLAASPLHVYYSREGRTYSLAVFFTILGLIALLRSNRKLALLWVACIGLAYTAASVFPVLAAFLISALGAAHSRSERKTRFRMAIPPAVSLALLPLLYGRYPPMSEGDRFAGDVLSVIARVFNALSYSAFDNPMAHQVTVVMAIFAGVGARHAWRGNREQGLTLLMSSGGVIVICLAALFWLDHWFSPRYIATALPAYLLLVGMGIFQFGQWVGTIFGKARPLLQVVVAILMAGLLITPGAKNAETEPQRKLDWRRMARAVWERAHPGDGVIVSNAWVAHSLRFYLRELPSRVKVLDVGESLSKAREITGRRGLAWMVTGGYDNPRIGQWISSFHPVLTMVEPVERAGLFFYPGYERYLLERSTPDERRKLTRWFLQDKKRGIGFEHADEPFVLAGFHGPESIEGNWFRWLSAKEARFVVPLDEPRTATLRLRMSPMDYPGAVPQRMEVLVNDRSAGSAIMRPDFDNYDFAVSKDFWRPGLNVVTLRFARAESPAQVVPGSTDRRLFSAAIDSAELLEPGS